MEVIARTIGYILHVCNRVYCYFVRCYVTNKFAKVGTNVYVGNHGLFTFDNIEIGNDVYIGANACMQSAHGRIIIGNHVMFGPGVHIHGGNHKIDEIGKPMKHASEKKLGSDGTVVIEDDCWIGANAIILQNVTIGQGCVIGAGSVVTKNLPPYSIYSGVPERRLRQRFNDEDLQRHLAEMELWERSWWK